MAGSLIVTQNVVKSNMRFISTTASFCFLMSLFLYVAFKCGRPPKNGLCFLPSFLPSFLASTPNLLVAIPEILKRTRHDFRINGLRPFWCRRLKQISCRLCLVSILVGSLQEISKRKLSYHPEIARKNLMPAVPRKTRHSCNTIT